MEFRVIIQYLNKLWTDTIAPSWKTISNKQISAITGAIQSGTEDNKTTAEKAAKEISSEVKSVKGAVESVYDDLRKLAITIKGDKGEKGEKGDKGDRGERGERGEKGERGNTGEKGKDGKNGKDGLTPIFGIDYQNGTDGEKGEKGDRGERGEKGEQGEKGERGVKGEKGEQGERGRDGRGSGARTNSLLELDDFPNEYTGQGGKYIKVKATEDGMEFSTVNSGGMERAIQATTGATAMGSEAGTDYVYFVAGAHAMTLPAASGNTNRYTVKNIHTSSISISAGGGDTIEEGASINIAPRDSVDLVANGNNWLVV